MRQNKVQVGWHYLARIGNRIAVVKVEEEIPRPKGQGNRTQYRVRNLISGRRNYFRSAARFYRAVGDWFLRELQRLYGDGHRRKLSR
jgi:hypothetical protein